LKNMSAKHNKYVVHKKTIEDFDEGNSIIYTYF
jgi:hypothetical protein